MTDTVMDKAIRVKLVVSYWDPDGYSRKATTESTTHMTIMVRRLVQGPMRTKP